MRKFSMVLAALCLSLTVAACDMGSISYSNSQGTPVISIGKEQVKGAIGVLEGAISAVEGAINKDTLGVAAAGWNGVEAAWDVAKEGVRSISPSAYENIGGKIAEIRTALDARDGSGAKRLLQELQTNIRNFKDSL